MDDENDIQKDDDEDESALDETFISWSNLLFLPFHPVFRFIVVCVVIVKSVLGPIQSVYPIVYCWDVMDRGYTLSIIKYVYLYCCDTVYIIDTFLHILHRQVTDEAMRREFLPKSGLLLMIDIISLIPFLHLTTNDLCLPIQIWPNLLGFNEFLTIYRIGEYLSLVSTHCAWKIVFGFIIMLFITVNCVTCFLLLLTYHGLCSNCNDEVYDWRKYVNHKLNVTDEAYTTYVYGASFVLSFILGRQFDETKCSTILEYVLIAVFIVIISLMFKFVIFPKMIAETILKLRGICTYYPHVQRIVEETQRRNDSSQAHVDVKKFYTLMWWKRSGITSIPEIIKELPRYLRIDVKQDLVWPTFHHSPTFRRTSGPYKRWLCERIRLDYKLPGENFFAGPHGHSNLYYLKSGVVQIMSNDDGITPLISLTSGTVFGDISFFLPPIKRNTNVRCLTYCEVLNISRADLICSLLKYPEDRRMIIDCAKDRIKHAHTLYNCKLLIRGVDRSEDEGIAWIKKRWWEISQIVNKWKNNSSCEVPTEDAVYHCSKYIGQLVLCTEAQLKKKSMFANVEFPWIFQPQSTFLSVWRKMVACTVFLVLLLYPPYITMPKIPVWFGFFQIWVDLIYVADLYITLTSSDGQDNFTNDFTAVIFAHFKTWRFAMDVTSTVWIETLVAVSGFPQFYDACQINRLIKVYVLFPKHDCKKHPVVYIYYKIILVIFCFIYIVSYTIYFIDTHVSDLTSLYFFGGKQCKPISIDQCYIEANNQLEIMIAWCLEFLFYEYLPFTLNDIYVEVLCCVLSLLMYISCQSNLVAGLYLTFREQSNYHYFVVNIIEHYEHHMIHPNLLHRLNRYLTCHWKYYRGIDVMHPSLLRNEPYDIYWKVHGEVAEKVIKASRAFQSADPAFIRELAYKAKFLVLPNNGTILMFGAECKNVTWIVNGHVTCEYLDDDGQLSHSFYTAGEMLATTSVFLGKPSIRTYSACTECEVIYIKLDDFFIVMKRYPTIWIHLKRCIKEFSPKFDEIFKDYLKTHIDYQKKLRDRIFRAKHSVLRVPRISNDSSFQSNAYSLFKEPLGFDMQSKFIRFWMLFRAITVFISITSATLQGGSGAHIRRPFIIISACCDCVGYVDIVLKMFLGYYNKHGILVSDTWACMRHYMSGTFILDLIGVLPCYHIVPMVMAKTIDESSTLIINTISKFAHLYLLMGYFNFSADSPSANVAIWMMVKWQVCTILLMLGASHYFVSKCIDFNWDNKGNLVQMSRQNSCWLPSHVVLDEKPTIYQLHQVFAQSLNLAQGGLTRLNLGKFQIDRDDLGVGIILLILGGLFWYIMCYSLALLILNLRGNTLFQHGVIQLRRFLEDERVDHKIIHNVVAHFRYWWRRTKGINIQSLMNERIGVVFRQDLNYFFYKESVAPLASILHGGESLERQLTGCATQLYFLPGEKITREMNLSPWVYIIHHGRIKLQHGGEHLALLHKGAVFGQLDGEKPRPVRVSSEADDYADLLQIPIKQFQEIINDEARAHIARDPQSKYDYMTTEHPVFENAYNSIQYVLRGYKAVKFPWMKKPVKANDSNWYCRWLFTSWYIGPVTSAILVLIFNTLPADIERGTHWVLILLDIMFCMHLVSEFFATNLQIEDNKCVEKVIAFRMFKTWGCVINIISLIVPIIAEATAYNWYYHMARLLRLKLLYDFHKHFCKGFKSRAAPIILKCTITVLLLHAMACGWIYVACRDNEFAIKNPAVPAHVNATIDYFEWTDPNERRGGCARLTKNYKIGNVTWYSFIVPRDWKHDYIISMLYIIVIFTYTEMDIVVALNLRQVYYKIFINIIMYFIDIWVFSVSINAMYSKFREHFKYDYNVKKLTTYLKHSGLCPVLLQSVKDYTEQLWRRQRGNWLPELALNAPQCLREDIFGALYIHHLEMQPVLCDLPKYFIRQMVSRFQRVVIFPGKFIVEAGDIFACMYFIHEGEVEKWHTDKSSGERKMISLLNTNGNFGLIPGLFPNSPFQFSYYARTVVDLVFLRLTDWKDILDGYPQIKENLYEAAKKHKREIGM